MSNRTLAEVRAECIAFGIQPGRSIAECERRIAERRASQAEAAADKARIEGEFAKIGAWPQGVQAITAAVEDSAPPPLTEKTRRREAAKREVRVSPALAAPYGKPRRMSRTMRMLCDTTAICGTLAHNPLVYSGDPFRHEYATAEGVHVAAIMQARRIARRGMVVRRR